MYDYDREGIIASGAADDAIRLFVDNKDGLVCNILLICFDLCHIAYMMLSYHLIFNFQFFMAGGNCALACPAEIYKFVKHGYLSPSF